MSPWEIEREYDLEGDLIVVCPVHLRFVPCRRCTPGEEVFSHDADDVARTRHHQQPS